jgi:hypothetical protein
LGTGLNKPSTAFQASHLALSFRLKMPGRPNRQNRKVQYDESLLAKKQIQLASERFGTQMHALTFITLIEVANTLFSLGEKRLTRIRPPDLFEKRVI